MASLFVGTAFSPSRDETRQIPSLSVAMLPFGEALAGRSPLWNGTVGQEPASGAVRCEALLEATRLKCRGPFKRTAVQSATAWVNADKISGGSSFSPSEPRRHVGRLRAKKNKEGWPEEPSHREKLQGEPQRPANSFTRISKPGLRGAMRPGRGDTTLCPAANKSTERVRQCIALVPQSTCQSHRREDHPNLVCGEKV